MKDKRRLKNNQLLKRKTAALWAAGSIFLALTLVLVFFIVKDGRSKIQNSNPDKVEGKQIAELNEQGKWFFLAKGIIFDIGNNAVENNLVVYAIMDHSQAQEMGIEPGDRLVQMNGYEVATQEDAQRYIQQNSENKMTFEQKNDKKMVVMK